MDHAPAGLLADKIVDFRLDELHIHLGCLRQMLPQYLVQIIGIERAGNELRREIVGQAKIALLQPAPELLGRQKVCRHPGGRHIQLMAGVGGRISDTGAASVTPAQNDDFHRPIAEASQGDQEQSRAGSIPANGDGAWLHHSSQIMAKAIMRADGTPQGAIPNGYIEKPVFTSRMGRSGAGNLRFLVLAGAREFCLPASTCYHSYQETKFGQENRTAQRKCRDHP